MIWKCVRLLLNFEYHGKTCFSDKKEVKMGLLSAGEPLDWEDMVQWQDHVRKYGVQQFIRLYNRLKVQFFKN